MIRYALGCERGHGFESWFRDAAACDEQLAAGIVECPQCGSGRVEKQLMAPSVRTSRDGGRDGDRDRGRDRDGGRQVLAAGEDQRAKVLREAVRKLRRYVEQHAENVGERFPEEARRIHYQEAEPRGIYGEATLEEARALIEEGIEAHPLPLLPDEAN